MATGPLERMIIGYAKGNEDVNNIIDTSLNKMGYKFEDMYSTVGRVLARVLEAKLVTDWMNDFYFSLLGNIKKGDYRMFNGDKWEPDSWPEKASGYSLTEAPRGSLAHYASFENKRITNYQMIMPTTWNGSPRDAKGQHSAFEASLIGTPVSNPNLPLEILRTIHSFDPCLACAVHLYDEKGTYMHNIDVK